MLRKFILILPHLLLLGMVLPESLNTKNLDEVITGIIINSDTNKAIEYATVTVINNESNNIIFGDLTDINGYFILSKPENLNYRIEIDFIGFKSLIIDDFTSYSSSRTLNLGNIFIEPKAIVTSEINVNAERPLYETTVNKKVYVIDQMKTTSGGTCCDVLKKVPSLDIGPNGEISLRGSQSASILIDGKRTSILGDERKSCAIAIPIPANMIDRIEIITSPSAEYDPDGMTGIINIILKEEKKVGYNGEFSINAGNTNKINLSSILNYRTNKIHIFSKLGKELIGNKSSGFQVLNSSDSTVYKEKNANDLLMMNIGLRYDMTDKMLFKTQCKIIKYNLIARDTIDYYGSQITNSYIDSEKDVLSQVYEMGFYANLSNTSRLDMEFDYNAQENNDTRDIFNPDLIDSSMNLIKLNKRIIKINYQSNLSDEFYYEIGYKGRFNLHNNHYNPGANTGKFQYDENVNALYSVSKFSFSKKIHAKAGIRFEQVRGDIEIDSIQQKVEIQNNYQHIYPSMHLIYKTTPYSNLKFAYSSRVNRQEVRMLDPFPGNQFSALVDTIGNPNLKPEFIDAFEISYSLIQEKYKTDFSLYHHNIKNVIQWNTDIDNITYNNSGEGDLNGLDIMFNVSPLSYWNFTFTGNYYKSMITRSTETNLNGMTSGGLIRCINMFKMEKWGDVELSSTYKFPKKITTGTIWPDGKFTIDMAYQVSLYDDQLKLTCKVINILDSDIYEQNITETTDNGDTYDIYSYRKYGSPTFYITIQYKFGNI